MWESFLHKRKNMIRIEAAIAKAKENGKNVLKKEIAAKLWPDSSEAAQQVNMTNLCNGRRDAVKPDWVKTICEMTGCSADFLFGLSNE